MVLGMIVLRVVKKYSKKLGEPSFEETYGKEWWGSMTDDFDSIPHNDNRDDCTNTCEEIIDWFQMVVEDQT